MQEFNLQFNQSGKENLSLVVSCLNMSHSDIGLQGQS